MVDTVNPVKAEKVQLRKSDIEDKERLKECLLLDEHHKDTDPKWWESPTGELYTFYDEEGHRVFVRIEKVLRVHIQHDTDAPRRNTARIIVGVHEWLKTAGKAAGFQELIFNSIAPSLVAFCKRHFSFEEVKDNYMEKL